MPHRYIDVGTLVRHMDGRAGRVLKLDYGFLVADAAGIKRPLPHAIVRWFGKKGEVAQDETLPLGYLDVGSAEDRE